MAIVRVAVVRVAVVRRRQHDLVCIRPEVIPLPLPLPLSLTLTLTVAHLVCIRPEVVGHRLLAAPRPLRIRAGARVRVGLRASP